MKDKDMRPPAYGVVEKAIADILKSVNVDMNDENYKDTPKRVAAAFTSTWLSGYDVKIKAGS